MENNEPMLEMFIFESLEMIDQLQQLILDSEKSEKLEEKVINEIFRIMHTIKGSSAMMLFENIAQASHSIEDLFYFIRESKPKNIDYSKLTDIVLDGSDLIKDEIQKINEGKSADSDFTLFINDVNKFLNVLKTNNDISDTTENCKTSEAQKYYISNNSSSSTKNLFSAVLYFEDNCEMENIRCFTIVHKLKETAEILKFEPSDIIENNETSEIIKKQGFKIFFKTIYDEEKVRSFFMETIFLKELKLNLLKDEEEFNKEFCIKEESKVNSVQKKPQIQLNLKEKDNKPQNNSHKQSIISVDVNKLDKLMDLVGELVISESMVTKNSEISKLQLDSFNKAARQLRKRLSDLQDIVMSIRMVPLSPTLNKMNRLVRDMCKKLNKDVELEIVGQDTEVDKNIIEHIGDPLMHIVRNSMDHGIEPIEERISLGKSQKGKISIEAKNSGGEVWIIIKDDGKGLDKEKILQKSIEHGLIKDKGNNMSDKEIYSLIFLPGFSTNDNVTEFSGRGVGMDVVAKEIEKIRGTVTIDSVSGKGTTISIKIPLTLAIIDGMTVKVGNSSFTIPVTSIRQSFIIKRDQIINDLDNNEMLLIRDKCYSILRLHQLYNIKTNIKNIEDGIVVMIEDEGKTKCIFADALIGEQQVVIKALPEYIKKVNGVSGCTLLGNGNISLILDVSQIVHL